MPRRIGRRKLRRLKRGVYFVANRRRRHYEENRKRRRSHGRRRRHYEENRKRRRSHRRRYAENRGRRRRHYRRNYRRNGFKDDLKSLLKMGSLVLVGFFVHKSLTGLAIRALTSTDASTGATTFAGQPTVGTDGKPTFLATWQKPLVGSVLGLGSIAALSAVKQVKSETRLALGAGVMTSLLQSIVHTALTVANQPEVLSYLEGYSNSAAYGLRGARVRRRRMPMRGLGVARHATSIMPDYTPIGATFQQAAAGTPMGEYFAQHGMGEYFAGPNLEGVGFYEKAGPLALQPSTSHMGQLPIDDGIRPDANLDHIMDLSESAAGVGQYRQAAAGMGQYRQAAAGMGEYISAKPGDGGGFNEFSVPTQDQWIPNGPLWAGTMNADAAYQESELPAGILQGPGGNGVLSG